MQQETSPKDLSVRAEREKTEKVHKPKSRSKALTSQTCSKAIYLNEIASKADWDSLTSGFHNNCSQESMLQKAQEVCFCMFDEAAGGALFGMM